MQLSTPPARPPPLQPDRICSSGHLTSAPDARRRESYAHPDWGNSEDYLKFSSCCAGPDARRAGRKITAQPQVTRSPVRVDDRVDVFLVAVDAGHVEIAADRKELVDVLR